MTRHTSGIYLHLYMEVIAKRCTVAPLSGILSFENVYRVYNEDECILCTLLLIKDSICFIKSQQLRCSKGIVTASACFHGFFNCVPKLQNYLFGFAISNLS